MTVTYTLQVSTARLCGFPKLLARWKGSIYRLMYREMLIFVVIYYSIAMIYRHLLPPRYQRHFEWLSIYCQEFTSVVPITFVMGFFVWFVVDRWWKQYLAIPWPDRCVLQISAYIQGADERGRLIRRSLARYLNLMSTLTLQATSMVIRKRFPTMEHLVEAGLLTVEERLALNDTVALNGNWWVPASWFSQLAMVARKEGRIHDDLHLKSLIDVVTIAVYSFFTACLFGRQYLFEMPDFNPKNAESPMGATNSHPIDFYIPLFTIFQFFFYVGWLKVAECMICPFGEDDDDFEMNWVVDRNVQMSYLTVDSLYRKYPKLVRDHYWDELDPEMPYTTAAAGYRKEPFAGSTIDMNITHRDAEWEMPIINEEINLNMLACHDDHDVESQTGMSDEGHENKRMPSKSENGLSRPRFLHALLAGNSRLSLVSRARFGSKQSISSTRSRKCSHRSHSRTHSPSTGRRGYHRRSTNQRKTSELSDSIYDNEVHPVYAGSFWRPSAPPRDEPDDGHFSLVGEDHSINQTSSAIHAAINPISDPIECSTQTQSHVGRKLSSSCKIQVDVPPPLREESEGSSCESNKSGIVDHSNIPTGENAEPTQIAKPDS